MGNSCTSVFPNTRAWEQQERNKIKKWTKKVRSEADEKKISLDCLSLPNQNTIITNIIFWYFMTYGKSTMKFN